MRAGVLILAALALACASPRERQVRDLMESPIVPSSDAIFGAVVYTNGQLAISPQTDADWARLEQHALRLVDAAAALRLLAPPERGENWTLQSDAMRTASNQAIEAIRNRNLDGILETGGKIYDTCTACHAVYAAATEK